MKSSLERGFTLLEIAVVVALIGIVTTFGVKLATVQFENTAISTTKMKQDVIRDALISYLGRNKRLPCPDTAEGVDATTGFTTTAPPDGRENRAGPAVGGQPDISKGCQQNFGVIPFAELGLNRETALDGWNNYFHYRITVVPATWHFTASFVDSYMGGIDIKDRNAGGTVTTSPVPAVVVVVSYGSDGFGATSGSGTQLAAPPSSALDEIVNTQAVPTVPPSYFARQATENAAAPGGPFNDIVLVLNARDLIDPNVKAGVFKPSQTAAFELIASVRAALLGNVVKRVLSGSCNPPNSMTDIETNPLDPWGRNLDFQKTPAFTTISASATYPSPPLSPYNITISSYGLDGTLGNSDDVTTAVTAQELRGYLGNAVLGFSGKCP